MKGAKGQWVRIHRIVLEPEERSSNLPEDTKKVPLELFVKGFLQDEAALGEVATVKTVTGRHLTGTLVEIDPLYRHGFGETPVPELMGIGPALRDLLEEEDHA